MLEALAFMATLYLKGEPGSYIMCKMSRGDEVIASVVTRLVGHGDKVDFFVAPDIVKDVSFSCSPRGS